VICLSRLKGVWYKLFGYPEGTKVRLKEDFVFIFGGRVCYRKGEIFRVVADIDKDFLIVTKEDSPLFALKILKKYVEVV